MYKRQVQEIGTVINTLKFARDAEEGIGMQVAQGNDSDSFACSCGSILGAYFADGLPEHLSLIHIFLNPQYGLLNNILQKLGLYQPNCCLLYTSRCV